MPRVLLSTLCDDVRQERSGKHILIGIFDQFTVTDFSAPLPGFRLFAQIGLETEGSHRLAIRISSEETGFRVELAGQIRAQGERSPSYEMFIGTLNIAIARILIPAAGRYKITFVIDGEDFPGPEFFARSANPPTIQ